MNMKMNVSTTIFIPSELASAVFPLGFVFLISLPPLLFFSPDREPVHRLSFTAKRKTQQERSMLLKLVLSLQFP